MTALEVRNLTKAYGAFRALTGVSLRVSEGERRAVIGPNGAGKSTLFNVIGGQTRPTAGQIVVNGTDVTGRAPYEIWQHGLTRTFQRNTLFPGLTVEENLRLAVQVRRGLGRQWFRRASGFDDVQRDVEDIAARVGLADRRSARAEDMAHGEQRQLEIGLALAGQPRLLLLDEPTAGMSPAETDRITAMLAQLPRSMTLMIVEHDMDVVFSLADRVTVLNFGEVLADGTPSEIQQDRRVLDAYLGGHG